MTSGITPSLAALDDAPSLRQREWIRGEPGEDVPQQHSNISGHLMSTTPRHEDMRLDPSLNVTPEGSLGDLPAAVGHVEEDRVRENQPPKERTQGAPSEAANVDISDTHSKTKSERDTREAPQRIQRTREASREDALASTQQFFATVDERIEMSLLEELWKYHLRFGEEMTSMYLVHLLLMSLLLQLSLMWNLLILAVPELFFQVDPHPDLLLQLLVDLEPGCNKSWKGKLMNLREKVLV